MADEILWTVKNGDLDSLKALLKDPNAVGKGRPLLVHAADYGQTEIVRFLISKGANVNQADTNDITPLLAAIWEDHLETVKVLLDNGADKKRKGPDGSSYCDAAESQEMKKLIQ